MGLTLQRMLVTLTAGMLLAAAAWAEDVQSAALQEIPEPPGVSAIEDPGYDAPRDAGCAARCEAGCGGRNVGCADPCGWLSNTSFFFASDAWTDQLDDNGPNNFGFRTGANAGFPILPQQGIGLQIGASVGLYDLLGRHDGDTRSVEDQTILTGGVFKRSNVCCGDRMSWAIVYDYQFHNDFAENGQDYIALGQFRGQIAYAIDAQREIGFWMTQTNGDRDVVRETGVPGGEPGETALTTAEPLNQYNFFWHRHWEFGGDTTVYLGAVEDPGEFVVGLNGCVPLNHRWSMFYGLHYVKPSADAGHPQFEEEIWNVTGGLVFYPGWNARANSVSGNRWMPLLPVADNGTFAVDQDVY